LSLTRIYCNVRPKARRSHHVWRDVLGVIITYGILYMPIIGKGKGHAHNRPKGPKGVPGTLRPRFSWLPALQGW
jgi:hypothetical protein